MSNVGVRARLARRATPAIVGLTVVLAVAACGGGQRSKVGAAVGDGAVVSTAAASGSAPGGNASGSASGQGDAAAANQTAPAGSSTGHPAATSGSSGSAAGASQSASTPLALTANVAKSCVKAGEIQTITIKAPNGSVVGYEAVYADGKGGLTPGYYGGNKGGPVDGSGSYTDSWVVGVGAPPGPVHVTVVGGNNGRKGSTTTAFKVADATGSCTGG